jgi:hypothetical protein
MSAPQRKAGKAACDEAGQQQPPRKAVLLPSSISSSLTHATLDGRGEEAGGKSISSGHINLGSEEPFAIGFSQAHQEVSLRNSGFHRVTAVRLIRAKSASFIFRQSE